MSPSPDIIFGKHMNNRKKKMSLFRRLAWPAISLAAAYIVLSFSLSYAHSSFRSQTHEEVDIMYSSSGSLGEKRYSSAQLAGLPEPVQRYLRYSIREGQKYMSYARLKHGGSFRPSPSAGWMAIEAEEYFSIEKPGYVWYAEMKPVDHVWLAARDRYFEGRGNVQAKLFSGVKVADSKGNETDQGAMVRFLGEAVWFPTAFLQPNIRWEEIDNSSARAYFTDRGRTVSAVFRFNESGEITSFSADRFMDRSLESFEGRCSNYEKIRGLVIPKEVEAVWHLKSGDYSYAKFVVSDIEWDLPSPYDTLL